MIRNSIITCTNTQFFRNSPLKFSSSPIELLTPAPLLGEHTREILKSMLGMKDEEVVTLRSAGII